VCCRAATSAVSRVDRRRAGTVRADPVVPGGHADPWDHVEAAMLSTSPVCTGRPRRRTPWLARAQRSDGSWAAKYQDAACSRRPMRPTTRATAAVGVWHHWRCTGDDHFLAQMWPTVVRALDFVPRAAAAGREDPVVAGRHRRGRLASRSSPAARRCTRGCAPVWRWPTARLGAARLELAVGQLRHALLCHPGAFSRQGPLSMDWYYPVLGGAWRGGAGLARIESGGTSSSCRVSVALASRTARG